MKIPSSAAAAPVRLLEVIPPEDLKRWHAPRPLALAIDLAGPWIQIVFAWWLVAAWNHPAVLIAAWFLVGGAQHGLTLIVHEFGHGLVFPGRPRLNDFVATWLFAAPSGLSFALYRHRHLDHHRFVSTEDDTKRLYRREYDGWNLPKELLLGTVGYDHAFQIATTLARRGKDAAKDSGDWASPRHFLPIIAVQLLILALFLRFWGVWPYLLLWLVPLVTSADLFAKLRSSVEHVPLKAERVGGPYYKGTAAPFFRTVRATIFERLFLSKINFHYHWEHHLWPTISYQHLPEAHLRLFARQGFPPPPGYLNVLGAMWRGR